MAKKKQARKAKRNRRAASDLSPRSARTVKGGGFDSFARLGDIKGESYDDRRR